jgi:hypothetical protein
VLIVCHAGSLLESGSACVARHATCYITFPAFAAAVITPFG